jgi:integrase
MKGQGRIFQRAGSASWWLDYYARGRRYRESARTTERKQAERLLAQRLREVGADLIGAKPFVGPAQERVKINQLLDALEADYKLRSKATPPVFSHLRAVRQGFGDSRAIHVTEEAIDRYVAGCLEQGTAPATVNRRLQLLGHAFRLAVRRKAVSFAPMIRRLSEVGNARQGFFEDGDFNALVEHLPDYLKDFARFAYLTGWRKGETASLGWADVDREGRVIRLRPEASKNGQGRVVVLEGELWSIIERRWEARALPTTNGKTVVAAHVFHLHGQLVGDFRQAWASACKKAGLTGKLFHDLRRTAVRNMVRAGVREGVAMEISGHRTRSIFDRYNITSERDLREAVRKTQDYLATIRAEPSVGPLATQSVQ